MESRQFANKVRSLALDMAKSAGKAGCHIGGSFSCLEILSVLYAKVLRFDVSNPEWEERDRFIPSKTHCILTHFASLACAGFLREEDLTSFHNNGGLLCGHPWNVKIGLEYSGGSLGMGLSVGIGFALNAKRYQRRCNTYVLLGDGECNEGSIWEAFMSASQFELDNLIAIIDYNNMQFDGPNDQVMSLGPLKDKLTSFGWETIEVDGHSTEDLERAFTTEHVGKPLAIIAKTIKAHGIPSLENKAESHHCSISIEEYNQLKAEWEAVQ